MPVLKGTARDGLGGQAGPARALAEGLFVCLNPDGRQRLARRIRSETSSLYPLLLLPLH